MYCKFTIATQDRIKVNVLIVAKCIVNLPIALSKAILLKY